MSTLNISEGVKELLTWSVELFSFGSVGKGMIVCCAFDFGHNGRCSHLA